MTWEACNPSVAKHNEYFMVEAALKSGEIAQDPVVRFGSNLTRSTDVVSLLYFNLFEGFCKDIQVMTSKLGWRLPSLMATTNDSLFKYPIPIKV